jgi:hypothetical protein
MNIHSKGIKKDKVLCQFVTGEQISGVLPLYMRATGQETDTADI